MSEVTLTMAYLIGQISKHFLIGQFFELFVQCTFIHGVEVISLAKLRSTKRKETITLAFQHWIGIVME